MALKQFNFTAFGLERFFSTPKQVVITTPNLSQTGRSKEIDVPPHLKSPFRERVDRLQKQQETRASWPSMPSIPKSPKVLLS
jgi:hypothetical protein